MKAYKVWSSSEDAPERYFTNKETAEAFAQIYIDPPNIEEIFINESFIESIIIEGGFQAFEISIFYNGEIDYIVNSTTFYVFPPSIENDLDEINSESFTPIDYNPLILLYNAKKQEDAEIFAKNYRAKLLELGKWIPPEAE